MENGVLLSLCKPQRAVSSELYLGILGKIAGELHFVK
jgi:hypothetical protein